MKTYVVTVIANMILEACEVFNNENMAFDFAHKVANARFNSAYIKEQWSDDMQGWIIGETEKYFISIVKRDINPTISSINDPMQKMLSTFKQLISDINLPINKLPLSSQNMLVQAKIQDQALDDPKAPLLPGAFSLDNKPLLMQDILNGTLPFKRVEELSEMQLTALLQARLNKRPDFMIVLDGAGLYSQKYAIEEFKNKTPNGKIIFDLLMTELYNIYNEINDTSFSSDEEEYSDDESSDENSWT